MSHSLGSCKLCPRSSALVVPALPCQRPCPASEISCSAAFAHQYWFTDALSSSLISFKVYPICLCLHHSLPSLFLWVLSFNSTSCWPSSLASCCDERSCCWRLMIEMLLELSWLKGHWNGLGCLSFGLLAAALALRRWGWCSSRAWKPLVCIFIGYDCSGWRAWPFEAMASTVCWMLDILNWSCQKPGSSFLLHLS